jgi:ribA/ribD-fused uncharacterized protein
MGKVAIREYDTSQSVVFLKTNEEFGGLSNMAGGYPLCINGVRIFTSEALYQACRFPHMPEIQQLIISQTSPMTAKMRSKPFRSGSRADWMRTRVKIMRWCLRAKLVQNWEPFSELLMKTQTLPIVEQSSKDKFWGASPTSMGTLVGANVLGRLLMELRGEVLDRTISNQFLAPLDIEDFYLYGKPIEGVIASDAIMSPHNRSLF